MFAKLMTKLTALEARVQLATGKFREKLLKKIAKLRARLGLGAASGVAATVAVGTIALAVAASAPSVDSASEQATGAVSPSAVASSMAAVTDEWSGATGLAKGRPAVRTVIDAPADSTDPTAADTTDASSPLVSTSSSGSLDEVTLSLDPNASDDSDSATTTDSSTTSTEAPATSSDATASGPSPTPADDAPSTTDTAADLAESTTDAPATLGDASTTSDGSSVSESSTTSDGSATADAPTVSTTSAATATTPSPDSTSSTAQHGSSLTSGSSSDSFVAAVGVMRVEEDWELVVTEPDKLVSAPQLGTVMAPLKDIEDVYLAFALNHRINPTYTTGGMELQLWYNGYQIGWLSLGNAHLGAKGEKVTWTQRLELKNGRLRFAITNGSSKTWGSFGQGDSIHLSVKTNLSDLNDYNPQVTVANSGVTFASNRVASLVLKAVRAYDSQGQLVASQTMPVPVFVPQN